MSSYNTTAIDGIFYYRTEMDAQQRVHDVAKKLCLKEGQLWQPTIDPNKPGGLTDEEKKQLTLEQEEVTFNQKTYLDRATEMFNDLSSVGYTITTN